MANIKERIYAEMENISRVLDELAKVKCNPNKELIILVGMGSYLQNIYSGIENILKQLLLYNNIPVPDKPTWHKDLLNLAIKQNLITKEIADKLGKYLVFRHFFTHSYGFYIDETKLNPLIDKIPEIYSSFKEEIDNYLLEIEESDQ